VTPTLDDTALRSYLLEVSGLLPALRLWPDGPPADNPISVDPVDREPAVLAAGYVHAPITTSECGAGDTGAAYDAVPIRDKRPLSLIDREWPLPLAFGARSLVPDSVRRLLQIIPAPGGRWPPAVCAAEPVVFREFAVTEEGLECPRDGKAVKQVRAYGVRTVGS
jgi:hypothetical protein